MAENSSSATLHGHSDATLNNEFFREKAIL